MFENLTMTEGIALSQVLLSSSAQLLAVKTRLRGMGSPEANTMAVILDEVQDSIDEVQAAVERALTAVAS